MSSARAALVATLVVLGAVVVVGVASAGIVAPVDSGGTLVIADNDSNETSMGARVSSFMQASVAQTNGSVETGMFTAAFNGTNDSDRAALVERRAGQLEARLDRLRERKQDLTERKDEMNPVAYRARMGNLVGRITALEEAINETEPLAAQVGVDTAQLDALRTGAANLSGPEVAAVASELGGPPAHAGPPDDRGNGGSSDGGDGSTPGDGEGRGQGNGSDRGNGADGSDNASDGGSSSGGPQDGGDGGPNDGGAKGETDS